MGTPWYNASWSEFIPQWLMNTCTWERRSFCGSHDAFNTCGSRFSLCPSSKVILLIFQMNRTSCTASKSAKSSSKSAKSIAILGVALIAFSAVAVIQGATKVKLGLDLRGGTSVTLTPRPTESIRPLTYPEHCGVR